MHPLAALPRVAGAVLVATGIAFAELSLLSPAGSELPATWRAHLALDAGALLGLVLLCWAWRGLGARARTARDVLLAAAQASLAVVATAVPLAVLRGAAHANIGAGVDLTPWYSAAAPDAAWTNTLVDAARLALVENALLLPLLLAPPLLGLAWRARGGGVHRLPALAGPAELRIATDGSADR